MKDRFSLGNSGDGDLIPSSDRTERKVPAEVRPPASGCPVTTPPPPPHTHLFLHVSNLVLGLQSEFWKLHCELELGGCSNPMAQLSQVSNMLFSSTGGKGPIYSHAARKYGGGDP